MALATLKKIHRFERQSDREGESGKERDKQQEVPSAHLLANGHNVWGWPRPKPRARESIWVSGEDSMGSSVWGHLSVTYQIHSHRTEWETEQLGHELIWESRSQLAA